MKNSPQLLNNLLPPRLRVKGILITNSIPLQEELSHVRHNITHSILQKLNADGDIRCEYSSLLTRWLHDCSEMGLIRSRFKFPRRYEVSSIFGHDTHPLITYILADSTLNGSSTNNTTNVEDPTYLIMIPRIPNVPSTTPSETLPGS